MVIDEQTHVSTIKKQYDSSRKCAANYLFSCDIWAHWSAGMIWSLLGHNLLCWDDENATKCEDLNGQQTIFSHLFSLAPVVCWL